MKKIFVIFILFIFLLSAFSFENISSNTYFILINKLQKEYKQNYKNSNYKKDDIFYKLQKEYEKYVYEMNSKDIDEISKLECRIQNGKYLLTNDTGNKKIDIEKYYKNGIKLHCSEAMSVFVVDYKWLENHYGKKLSKEYKLWLNYLKKPVSFEEGFLNEDIKILNKQISKLEYFLEKYPNFVANDDIKIELKKLKSAR